MINDLIGYHFRFRKIVPHGIPYFFYLVTKILESYYAQLLIKKRWYVITGYSFFFKSCKREISFFNFYLATEKHTAVTFWQKMSVNCEPEQMDKRKFSNRWADQTGIQ